MSSEINTNIVISANEVLKNIQSSKDILKKAYNPMIKHIVDKPGRVAVHKRINESEYNEKLNKVLRAIEELEDVFLFEYKEIHKNLF